MDIPQELKDSLRKFRFTRRSKNAALVVKINKQKLIMEEVEQFDDIELEDLAEGIIACRVSHTLGSRLIFLSRRAPRGFTSIRRAIL